MEGINEEKCTQVYMNIIIHLDIELGIPSFYSSVEE